MAIGGGIGGARGSMEGYIVGTKPAERRRQHVRVQSK